MKWIKEYQEIRFEKHKKDWDTVIAIDGDEGVSKSNLNLHMLDYWCELLNGECKPEDIKHMCLTGNDFIDDLSDSIPNEYISFDEAGELDSRRAMSDFNVKISQAYQVIRADRLFTTLVLPSFWDLETRFRLRRVKALFHVYARGKVAVYLKDKVRLLCQLNEHRKIKSYYGVSPDFYANFPIYKGVLADKYKELKKKKTQEARSKLKEMKDNKRSTTNPKKIAYLLLAKKQSPEYAKEILEIPQRTEYTWRKELLSASS